jgi:hypothetical protein
MPYITGVLNYNPNGGCPQTYATTASSLQYNSIDEEGFWCDEETIDLLVEIAADKNMALLNCHHDNIHIRKVCEKILKKGRKIEQT